MRVCLASWVLMSRRGQPLVGGDAKEVRLCRSCRLHCHARCWMIGDDVCLRCHVERREELR
jgi:hypothetical protein